MMHGLDSLYLALIVGTSLIDGAEAGLKPGTSIRLSNVKSLTLRNGQKTSHRRASPIPQLQCVGGNARGLYEVDVMRCRNQGSDYDDENIQWSCTASLPAEFKLGATDVLCEGYDSPDDPKVLKGSCGVQYRLVLTEAGEKKYGRRTGDLRDNFRPRGQGDWSAIIFWMCFVGIVGWMIYSAFFQRGRRGLDPLGGGDNRPWGGGGGGGGGGFNDDDDPPPPYDYHHPPSKTPFSTQAAPSTAPGGAQQAWRPGFWTTVLGGAAVGYLAANRGRSAPSSSSQEQEPRQQRTNLRGERRTWGNPNAGVAGSSRWGGSGGYDSTSSSSSISSSSRYESTGFGSTSRR